MNAPKNPDTGPKKYLITIIVKLSKSDGSSFRYNAYARNYSTSYETPDFSFLEEKLKTLIYEIIDISHRHKESVDIISHTITLLP